ncbi:hypothetical protein WR25_20549 [Diploscapter pachys]|uniref:Uncharacterized protein n=1 Tax=Diploscapter pachys TaxID=2018661 RepID=A0A2A2M5S2_9BILA|nr:hypothetical protein WR25_20549 [Diploscapter pachys]
MPCCPPLSSSTIWLAQLAASCWRYKVLDTGSSLSSCQQQRAALGCPATSNCSPRPLARTSTKGSGLSPWARNRNAPRPSARSSAWRNTRFTAATMAWLER